MNAAMLEYLYIWLAFVVRSPYEQGVTMANSNQCAYLLCSYYLSCKTSDDFQEFTTACARNDLPVTTWRKKRKKIYKFLCNKYSYKNGSKNGEDITFKTRFSVDNFKMMAEEDRARHTLTNCRACPIGDDQQMYLLLRCNKIVERGHQEPVQQQERPPVGERQAPVGGVQPEPGLFTERFKELLSTTPNMAIGASCKDIGRSIEKTFNEHTKNYEHSTKLHDTLQPKKANHPDQVTKKAKDAIIAEALASVKHQAAENDFYSLYTGDQSERGYERARLIAQRDTTNRPSRPRSSTGRLESYQYDEEALRTVLVDNQDDLESLNWSLTSRNVQLKNASGQWPKNGGQVCCYAFFTENLKTC